MTRTKARELAVQLIYAVSVGDIDPNELIDGFFTRDYFSSLTGEDGELYSSRPNVKQREYIRVLVNLTFEHITELDGYIEKYARGWRTERISKTAMAVLRCALCEIIYMDEIPPSAAINEAVELSKGYDEPETVAFINGILGAFMRGERGVEVAAETDNAEFPDEDEPEDEESQDAPEETAPDPGEGEAE